MSLSNNTNISNEEYVRKCICQSSLNSFSNEALVDTQALLNNLRYGNSYDGFRLLPKLSDIMQSINDKTEKHFVDMEFALDEYGEPDGLKNEQEIVMTVASEVSEEVAEEVFNNIKTLLLDSDHINELAMELLKESKED